MEEGKKPRRAGRYQRKARREVEQACSRSASSIAQGNDLMFIPIAVVLVLLPMLADVVEGIIRAFLSAAFSMGGLL